METYLYNENDCNFRQISILWEVGYELRRGGDNLTLHAVTSQSEKAYSLLQEDAEKIRQLIEVQLENLTMPQCPLYEEVLDTRMFGLSREIDFAIRLGLVEEEKGKGILSELERKLALLHDSSLK